MKKICLILFASLLLAGCETSNERNEGKTPYTRGGKFNSCTIDEAHDMKEAGFLADTSLDVWTTAQEIIETCRRKLKMDKAEINETQSLNMIVSLIKTLR